MESGGHIGSDVKATCLLNGQMGLGSQVNSCEDTVSATQSCRQWRNSPVEKVRGSGEEKQEPGRVPEGQAANSKVLAVCHVWGRELLAGSSSRVGWAMRRVNSRKEDYVAGKF